MNLLITGAWQCTGTQLYEILTLGHEVKLMQNENEDLPCEYEWVEGIICNSLFLYHPIEKFSHLKFIQLTSAGYDRVPLDYINEHGIEIHNAKGVYSIPMAEYAVCGVLEIYKQTRFFYENQKQHKWEKHRGLLELCGKTVLVVGCGDIGTECAKRFNAFGCNVIGLDLKPRENVSYSKMYGISEMDYVLPKADVIVLTVPLTENTHHMIGHTQFELMKETAILVNISRGAVVDQKALESHVDNLGGAVLDVFEDEPLYEDNPLWEKDNIFITPHNSFVSDADNERKMSLFINNVLNIV